MLLFSHRNKNSNQTDLNIPVFLIRNYIPNNYDEYLEAPWRAEHSKFSITGITAGVTAKQLI